MEANLAAPTPVDASPTGKSTPFYGAREEKVTTTKIEAYKLFQDDKKSITEIAQLKKIAESTVQGMKIHLAL